MDDMSALNLVLSCMIGVIGYLLKRKDDEQAKLIDTLFNLHGEDAHRLHQVELKIAQDHYVKSEMDAKFDKLETAMKSGFTTLGNKFDVLNSTLVASRAQEEMRKTQ